MRRIFQYKRSSLSLIIMLLSFGNSIAQDSYLKVSIRGVQFDNIPDLLGLDDSYNWDEWQNTGLSTLGIEYQRKYSDKISYKPFIGLSSNSLRLFDYGPIRVAKGYYTYFINVGLMVNYHFNENYRGFNLGIGPSFYFLANHNLRYYSKDHREVEETSKIRDRFNTLPILLQLEMSYSFKLISFKKATVDLEIGYTPSLKLNGFINGYSTSPFMHRGLRMSANLSFDPDEKK